MGKITLMSLYFCLNTLACFSQKRHSDFPYLDSLFFSGKYEEAIELIDTTAQNFHSQIQTLNFLGRCHLENSDLISARYYFTLARGVSTINTSEKYLSLLGIANIHLAKGDVQLAKKILLSIDLEQLKRLNDLSLLSQIHTSLAKSYFYSDEQKTREHFDLAIKYCNKQTSDLVMIYLSYIDFLLGDYQKEASDLINKVEELLEHKLSDHQPYRFRLEMYKAQFLLWEKRHQESQEICHSGLKKASHNLPGWKHYINTRLINILFLNQMELRSYYDAIETTHLYAQEVKKLRRPIAKILNVVNYRLYLLNYNLGNYDVAVDYLKACSNYEQVYTLNRSNLFFAVRAAEINWELGNLDKAIATCDSVISRIGNRKQFLSYSAQAYFVKYRIFLSEKELSKAESAIDMCLMLNENLIKRKPENLLNIYESKASLMTKRGNFQEADRVFQKILPYLDVNNLQRNETHINLINKYAAHLLVLGRLEEALFYLQQILEQNRNVLKEEVPLSFTFLPAIANTLQHHAEYYSLLENKNGDTHIYQIRADSSYSEALRVLEKVRYSYRNKKSRIWVSEIVSSILGKSITKKFSLYKECNEIDFAYEIFKLIEEDYSNSLVKSVNRKLVNKDSTIPDSVEFRIVDLQKQSSYLKNQIDQLESRVNLSHQDSTKLNEFRFVMRENKVAFNNLMLHLEQNYPNYYEVNYNPQVASIQTVKDRLKSNEALLEYFVGSDGIYAFAIASDTAQVFKLDTIGDQRIQQFQDMIQPEKYMADQSLSYQEYIKSAHGLFIDLVKQPLSLLEGKGINKLYIVPDKHLNYLPFELLLTEKPASDRPNYKGLNYLLKDYSVSYGYSASILFRENPMRKDRTYKGNMLAVAPSYQKILSDTTELARLGKFRDGFAELKYNKSEVDGIGSYFDGEVLKGDQATEEAFTDKFQQYDILHLAMHALVDNEDSDKSKLVFTPQKDSLYDSYLHNFELYNLNMNPKMAVLSACNTGFGSLASGEGVMSLARAFTYAGAESVVMSHWRVDDQASSTIMQSFYKYLADGQQKDEALRLAKLDYLDSAPATAQHPFHWNNFVVLGDVSSLKVPFVWYKAWWVYLIGVLLIASTIIYRRNFSRG